MNEEIVRKINASEIVDPKNPMRGEIDREGIFNLAESIKREGLINPITVRPAGGKFEVVAGHRRFLACKLANVIEISCVIRELSDEQADEIMAHENLERQDVDVVEEALLVGRLVGENDGGTGEVAKRLNRSRGWVEARLEILAYPDFMIEALKKKSGIMAALHFIGMIEDVFWQRQYTNQLLENGMSASQASYLYELWKIGGSPGADVILPGPEQSAPDAPLKLSALCSACGVLAVDPNLTQVWVHRDCNFANPLPLKDTLPDSPPASSEITPPLPLTSSAERGSEPYPSASV